MSKRMQSLGSCSVLVAAGLALADCAVGPDYHRPPLPASAGFGAEAVSPAPSVPPVREGEQPRLVSGMDIPAQWWSLFHCADLDALVAIALKNNSSIAAADAALRAAHEETSAQRGAFFPTVGASIEPSRQSFARTLASPTFAGNSLYNLTTTQVSVSYTPDIFGANTRAVESLVAQEDQQRYQLAAARVTLASNVVLTAIQDAMLREQIALTHAIIDDQQKTMASFQRQYALGQASKADLAAQEALLAQVQATLPPLDKQYRVNRDLLSALVGQTPGEPLEVRFESLTLPEQLPISLPAQIVEHRPDVLMAEAQLHAASAQIGVAVAARLPNLEIDGAAGSSALGLLPAFSGAANFWSVTATLSQPVFDGFTLFHRERAARAAFDQAAAQYQGTVIGAFQNTADVMHALWTDADALRAAEAAAHASGASLDIARKQLGLGDVSQLAVLVAEQTDDQARLALLQAKANRYSDVAALFEALGGGWWNQNLSQGTNAVTASTPVRPISPN